MSTPYVYELYVDGVLRYIGKGRGQRRDFHAWYANHINYQRSIGKKVLTTKFYNRLAKAIREGAQVSTRIIRYYSTDEAAFAGEIYYIAKATGLWNKYGGGQGVTSEEARLMSKLGWADPEVKAHRLKQLQALQSKAQEGRSKSSAKAKFKRSMRDYWSSKEFANLIKANAFVLHTVGSKAKAAKARQEFFENGGRQVIADSNRRRLKDLEWKKRNIQILKEALARNNANPAFRAKCIDGIKAYWQKRRAANGT